MQTGTDRQRRARAAQFPLHAKQPLIALKFGCSGFDSVFPERFVGASAYNERQRDGWQQSKQLLLSLRRAFSSRFHHFISPAVSPLLSRALACGLHVSERMPFTGNYRSTASLCIFPSRIKNPQRGLKKHSNYVQEVPCLV